MDPVAWKIQYKQDGKWVDVDFDAADQQTAKTGKLVLTFTPDGFLDDPKVL